MSKDRTSSFNLNSFTNIFSTPSVVTGPAGIPWYETLNCQDSVDMIFEYEEKAQESFIGMGYFFKRIKEKELYRELGYDNMWTFAKEQCNMDESSVSRFINLCEKFSINGNTPMLDNQYKGYSKSQLIEMLTIKDEQTMEKVTPDMTVKEIREIKKESSDEPTDDDIKLFFNRNLRHCINPEQFADLKKYMYENYRNAGGGGDGCDYKGSSRGITLNHHAEITWAKFVSRVYLLEDLVPDSIKNQAKEEKEDVLPGQLDLENDFPQYCPESVGQKACVDRNDVEEKNCDVANDAVSEKDIEVKFPEKEEVIIDGEFREIQEKPADEVIKIKSARGTSHIEEAVVEEREDSMTKYKCNTCLQQFILGDYAVEVTAANSPKCPYCGQKNLEWTTKAVPGEIEDMGCMTIWATIF